MLNRLSDDASVGTPQLLEHLTEAYKALYPDGDRKLFSPDTVDFFSSLQAYVDIGAPGLPGVKLHDARELLRSLKFALTRLLVTGVKTAESNGRLGHAYLDDMVVPGNIIITTNWDLLIERVAQIKAVKVRRSGKPAKDELLLLKLHGSVDWLEWPTKTGRAADPLDDYATIREVSRRISLPNDDADEIVRVRIADGQWGQCWRRIKSRVSEPFIVTMYRGKGSELAALSDIWADAYGALSQAKRVEIVGYSLPPDDLEIRTLLRAGLTRGRQKPSVTIRNPAPDVHARIRQHVLPTAVSDYSPV